MDENEKIDNIKYKILEKVDELLDYGNDYSASIKNLVESYEILNNIYQEEI